MASTAKLTLMTDRKPVQTVADRLLTPEEASSFLGLSIETLAQWRSQRRGIPFVKVSRNCVRYQQGDLDAWVAQRIVHVAVDPSNATRRI